MFYCFLFFKNIEVLGHRVSDDIIEKNSDVKRVFNDNFFFLLAVYLKKKKIRLSSFRDSLTRERRMYLLSKPKNIKDHVSCLSSLVSRLAKINFQSFNYKPQNVYRKERSEIL